MKKSLSILIILILLANLVIEYPLSVNAAVYNRTSMKNPFSLSSSEEDDNEDMDKKSIKEYWGEKIDKAGDTLNSAKITLDESVDSLKDNMENVSDSAKEKASELTSKAGEIAETAKEKAIDTGEKTAETIGKAKDAVVDAGKAASEKAGEIAEDASEAVNAFAEQAKALLDNFDKEAFDRGWKTAANLLSSRASSVGALLKDQAYIDSVSKEIQNARKAIYEQAVKDGPKASRAGFVAEEWHAGSFNASAKAAEVADYASTPNSTKAASVDIEVKTASGGTENYSLKYYKDGASSATAQAENFMQKYMEYVSRCEKNGTEPISKEDFLNEYAASNDVSSMYDSVYKGQARLIPAGQEEEAAKALKQKIAKEASRNREASSGLIAGYEDTLSNLTATVTNADGTVSSVPLSKEDAEKIVELCRSDPDAFKPEDFGLSTAQLIPMSHIANLAIQGGAQSGIINVALAVGPELFQIIRQLIETGELDQDALIESGFDALTEGSKGFIEGAASTAILECCQIGKFGPAFTDVNPSIVGALTVLTVDAIIYSYQLNKGEITSAEYGDRLAEEIFVTVVSLGTGTLVQVLLPMIPGAYFAGSIAGSMLASTGYAYGEDLVLAAVNNGGMDMIVPIIIEGKETIANSFLSLDLADILSPFEKLKIDKAKSFDISILNFVQHE